MGITASWLRRGPCSGQGTSLLSPRMVQLFKAVDCPVGMVTADILVVKSCDVRNVCNFIGLYSAI